jgi:hypothetical protein
MGVAYQLDERLGLTLTVFDGLVSADEWRSVAVEIFTDPDWPPGKLNLTDLRTADTSALTAADRAEIIALNGSHAARLAGMKSAAIGGANFEVANTYEREDQSSGMRIIVFNDLTTACGWLGVSTQTVGPMIEQLRRRLREPSSI